LILTFDELFRQKEKKTFGTKSLSENVDIIESQDANN
jgi:hypothetical protein